MASLAGWRCRSTGHRPVGDNKEPLGKGQSRASCAGFPQPGGMAQAQVGKVKGPLRTALFLTQGVGSESSKFQRKDEGAFWELQMGDLPRDNRVKTIDLVFRAEQAWIPMGIDRRLMRGTGQVGACARTRAHTGHTHRHSGVLAPLRTSSVCALGMSWDMCALRYFFRTGIRAC